MTSLPASPAPSFPLSLCRSKPKPCFSHNFLLTSTTIKHNLGRRAKYLHWSSFERVHQAGSTLCLVCQPTRPATGWDQAGTLIGINYQAWVTSVCADTGRRCCWLTGEQLKCFLFPSFTSSKAVWGWITFASTSRQGAGEELGEKALKMEGFLFSVPGGHSSAPGREHSRVICFMLGENNAHSSKF